MFDIQEAVKEWLKTLRNNQGLEDGYVEELHSHLLDEIDHHLEEGKSEAEAFEIAVTNLGSIDSIGADYYKTNTRRLVPVLSDQGRDNILALFFNFFKIAIRRIKKHKGYSFINIMGLAIGMACTIFILRWVQNELSYDRFHQHADELYVATFSNGSLVTPTALGNFLKSEYPEIIRTSRFFRSGGNLIRFEKREILAENGIGVEPDFLRMFTFHFLKGVPETALRNSRSIIISEGLSKKLFGEKNPIDKIVTFSAQYDVKVTGVFRNYPANSHFQCEYMLPFTVAGEWNWIRNMNTWEQNNIQTYVQLLKNTVVGSVDAKISDVVEKHKPQDKRSLSLQPITRLHLNPLAHSNVPITYVYIFSTMAFFILLIACINFMNLTTARSITLGKEVGIRKTVGACRIHLIRQFFGESIITTIIAMIASIGLIFLFLPHFNRLTNQNFSFGSMFKTTMFLGIIGILMLTGILSGSYPSLFLSRFQITRVLKGTLHSGIKGATLRKVLVVTQFSISILLILCTMMVFKQVHFLKEQDVGFNRDNIVYFGIGQRFRDKIDTIKTELLANPKVLNVTMTDVAPYRWQSNAGEGDVHWEGKTNQKVKMVMVNVDTDYLDTFGMTMAQGRFFSKQLASDQSGAFLVNETAVRAMEMENPIGKELRIWNLKGRIIGVVKDYHFESLHREIIPMAMGIRPDFYGQACVRIHPGDMASSIQFLKKEWKKIYPEYPFEYHFLDDRIRDLYHSEEDIGRLVKTFSFLAIFISCLGLFGLAAFMTEKRTKEIGIRKVCGASISGLIYRLSGDFLMLVFYACVIAVPAAVYLMNLWLRRFAYRTGMDAGIIGGAVFLALTIAFATVSYHTMKSAMINPSNSLRNE